MIHDEDQVREFLQTFCHEEQGLYYWQIQSRPKYGGTHNNIVVCGTVHKGQFDAWIQGLCEHDGRDHWQLWIKPNPRDPLKATKHMQEALMTQVMEPLVAQRPLNLTALPDLWIRALGRSAKHKVFEELDVDTKDEPKLQSILELFDTQPAGVVETKHGYHFIYKASTLPSSSKKTINAWSKQDAWRLTKVDARGEAYQDPVVSMLSDPNSVVPGTSVGGFKLKWAQL